MLSEMSCCLCKRERLNELAFPHNGMVLFTMNSCLCEKEMLGFTHDGTMLSKMSSCLCKR